MDYGPHPTVYACAPRKRCFPSPAVTKLMISNTVACNKLCNDYTAAILMLPLPRVTIPVLAEGGVSIDYGTQPVVYAMSEVFALVLCAHINDLKHCYMRHVM